MIMAMNGHFTFLHGKTVNATIGGVGMLFSPYALKIAK